MSKKSEESEYDELIKSVDDHLAKDYMESVTDTLHYRMGIMPKPPLWIVVIIIIFIGAIYLLFTNFDWWLA